MSPRIEAWPIVAPYDEAEDALMLLVDRHRKPLVILSADDLGNVPELDEAAEDLLVFCAADIVAHPDTIAESVAEWRRLRVVHREGEPYPELRGSCVSCDGLAVATSPGGEHCEDERCWPEVMCDGEPMRCDRCDDYGDPNCKACGGSGWAEHPVRL